MMFKLIIFFTLATCVYSAVLKSNFHDVTSNRIVGGQPIDITEAPYQVVLLYDSAGTGDYKLKCGGSIVGKSLIVTAAHCVYLTNQLRWKVRAGSKFHASGGQLVDVISHQTHKKYDAWDMDFDIAVMKLAQEISIDNITTKIIPLAVQDQFIPDNSSVIASGWGSTYSGGNIVEELRAVALLTVNQEDCEDAYSKHNIITENMICAGYLKQGGKDACQGDSGGPLVLNNTLIGVTSWGRGCASIGYPGVWSRIPALRSWIDENS